MALKVKRRTTRNDGLVSTTLPWLSEIKNEYDSMAFASTKAN